MCRHENSESNNAPGISYGGGADLGELFLTTLRIVTAVLLFWVVVLLSVLVNQSTNGIASELSMNFSGLNVVEFLKIATGLGTLTIAYLALQNWKFQSLAKNKIDFMDAFGAAIHEYVDAVPYAVVQAFYIQIEFMEHAEDDATGEEKRQGAIKYINSKDINSIKSLSEALDKCRPSFDKIRFLESKGRVFQFDQYEKCLRACTNLRNVHKCLLNFKFVISRTNADWDNPEYSKYLDRAIACNIDELEELLGNCNKEYFEFEEAAYRQIYDL